VNPALALLIAALLAASGCAPHALHAEEAAALIKRYRTDHCRGVEVSEQPGAVAARNAAESVATLLRGQRVDRKMQTVVRSGFGDYSTELVTFRGGGVTENAVLTEMHYPDKPWSDKVDIRGCMFVPARIEISDIVLESPTTGHVLFTEHLELSPLGKTMNRYRLLDKTSAGTPSEAHEFHFRMATLRFDGGAIGWVVSSVGPAAAN